MIILKPKKGFVIPVVYMSNDKLYSENLDISFQQESQAQNLNREESIRNSLFRDNDSYNNDEAIEDEIVRDSLWLDDDGDIKEENESTIAAILEKNSDKSNNGRGMLVFDDTDDIEIDENKSIELEQARSNFRKAIEVEIEKVGKLVLDDDEIKVNSKISVNSSEANDDAENTDTFEENIPTDDSREKNIEEHSNSENEIKDEIVKESEDNK